MIEEMTTLYYPPFRASTQDELLRQSGLALERYIKELAAYDRETLETAWSAVIKDHTSERWPTIGRIVTACEKAKPRQQRGVSSQERDFREQERAVELARHTLFETELGQRAAIERWPQDLKLFIEREGRLPTDYEIAQMAGSPDRTSAIIADLKAKVERGEEVAAWPNLQNMYRMMAERNAELAEMILKGREDGEAGTEA